MLAVGDDPSDDDSRVLILAKSNLGRLDVPALRYRIEGRKVDSSDGDLIETSGVAWLGEAPDIGAGDIFRSGDPDENTTAEDMAAMLREILADGAMNRREVKSAMRDPGYSVSDKALQRLCTRLGVTRQRGNFGGQVRLILPDTQSGQSPHSGQIVPMTRKGVHDVTLRPTRGFVSSKVDSLPIVDIVDMT